MSADTTKSNATKANPSAWKFEHRRDAYTAARSNGLVVAPPLNPPPTPSGGADGT